MLLAVGQECWPLSLLLLAHNDVNKVNSFPLLLLFFCLIFRMGETQSLSEHFTALPACYFLRCSGGCRLWSHVVAKR
jgi:hypothetical protein